MKKMQWVDLFREIKRSRGRYLSLLFIVALGTAFYAGVRSAEPDMSASADMYYNETRLMDIRVLGTLGLTDADLEAICDTDGIRAAEAGYSTELMAVCKDSMPIVNVASSCEEMNQMSVMEGRIPEAENECFLDKALMEREGYVLGDTITLVDEKGNVPENLKTDTFTIVGSGTWSWYLSLNRGSASIGDGALDAFMVIPGSAFDMDCYTVIYARVEGGEDYNTFTEEYDAAVELVTDRLEEIADARCDIRYTQVYDEAEQKLMDARQEVADAKQELADAKQKLDDGEKEYADGKQEYQDGKTAYADGKKALADGKKTLADSRKELDDGWKEYEDGKSAFEQAQKELNSGEQQLQAGQKQLTSAKEQLADGKKELSSQKKTLDEKSAEVKTGLSAVASGEKELKAAEKLLNKKAAEVKKAEAEIKSESDKLKKAEKTLNTQSQKLKATEADLNAKAKELKTAQAAYDKGLAEYNAGKAQLTEAKTQLTAAKKELTAAQKAVDKLERQAEKLRDKKGEDSPEYKQAKAEWSSANSAYQAQKNIIDGEQAEYDAAKAKLEASRIQLSQAGDALRTGKAQLQTGREQVKAAKAELASAEKELKAGKKALEAGKKELAAGKAELKAGQKELAAQKAELAKNKKELQSAQAQVSAGYQSIASAQKELDDTQKTLIEKEKTLAASRSELLAGKKELNSSQKELDAAYEKLADGESAYTDGVKEFKDSKQELKDAKQELTDAKNKLQDARTELDDGWKEYEDAVKEAEPKIADAEKEIADGEKALSELSEAKWFVLGRDTIQNSVEYGMDSERIGAIGKVFPAIFFLVAALVSLTTMTRMIEEERMLIGTMKAMGYSKLSIASKYIMYAFSATLIGGVLGVTVGSKILPYIIMSAYGMLYNNVQYMLIPLHADLCISSIGIALICTVGAAFLACYKELLSSPAALMRPPAPKQGKRVWLEYLPFIWKRLNFSMKSTIRNLIRYKKRFFMTVFGIGGCMAVLLVSFGLHDSIAEIVNNQYKNIWTYSAYSGIDDEKTREEQEQFVAELTQAKPEIESTLLARVTSLDISTDAAEKTAFVYTPEDAQKMEAYLHLHDRVTKEDYKLSDEGAIITEKLAHTLDVKVGDTVTMKLNDTTYKEVAITAVSENYLHHYLYITPALYEKLYGEMPKFNEVYMQFAEGTGEAEEKELAEYVMNQDMVKSVSLVRELQASVDDMMNALNMVVWVLIISAGLLVFVVLFNLNNINISERRRELASLKVLGFYDSEVAMYVYRENIFLTIFGVAAGLFMGTWLHQYTILTLEVDMIMFGRNISQLGYIKSIVFTVVFSILVNLGMYYKLRQIDMVESLKSVE